MIKTTASKEHTYQARVVGYSYSRHSITLTRQTGSVDANGNFTFHFNGNFYQEHFFISGEAFDHIKKLNPDDLSVKVLLDVISKFKIEGKTLKVDGFMTSEPPGVLDA